MSETRTKSASSFKLSDEGEVEVVFATLDVVDHDGDVLRKSSFDDGSPVVISAYGHRSHSGELPVGKGRIVMSDSEAKMVGRFFLDTSHGLDTYRTVKALDEEDALQEWSFSLRNVEAHTEKVDGQNANVIDHVDVKEVSPVLEGAGINTRTVGIKARLIEEAKTAAGDIEVSLRDAGRERWGADETYVWVESWDPDASKAVYAIWKDDEPERLVQVSFDRDGSTVTLDDDETDVTRSVEFVPKSSGGARLAEQAKAVLADLRKLTDRAAEVVAMRAHKSKGLSRDTAAVVAELDAEVGRLREMIPTGRTMSDPLVARITLLQLEDA